MALERPGSLRRTPFGTDRRLTGGRLLAALVTVALLFAIVLPGATLISLELDRRSLLVERTMKEAQLYLLREDIRVLTSPAPSVAP